MKLKDIAIFILKLSVSVLSVWFVLSKTDTESLKMVFAESNIFLLLLALLSFVFSKLISAERLYIFFRNVELVISRKSNLRLYILGMFYNLFLPGGIGGDGYKVWLLKRNSSLKLKSLLHAIILDRVNGLIAIVLLVLVFVFFLPEFSIYNYFAPIAACIVFLLYAVAIDKFFPKFSESLFQTTALSLTVQMLQTISVLFIAHSIGIHNNIPILIIVFLASSVLSVIPVTIGGVGLREIVFMYGCMDTFTGPENPIAVSLMFFLITVLTSFLGIWFVFKPADSILNES